MNSVSLRKTKNFITNADFKNLSAVKIAAPNVEENEGVAVGLAADDSGSLKPFSTPTFFLVIFTSDKFNYRILFFHIINVM